jgi:CRISPR system Cascade subunit CasE
MMYLSTLLVNVGDNPDRPRPGRLWLRNRYHVHQRLCMAFPSSDKIAGDPDFLKPFVPGEFGERQVHVKRGGDNGFLFRVDPLPGGEAVILVQSATKPDWEYAFCNAEYLLKAPVRVKPFFPSFDNGQLLRFRLVVNPTKKIETKTGPDGKRNNGKRVPVHADRLFEWLSRKGQAAGFRADQKMTTTSLTYVYVNKGAGGSGQRLRSVRFDGVLQVIDVDALHHAIAAGIGSGKAFGFGLLSLTPYRESGD